MSCDSQKPAHVLTIDFESWVHACFMGEGTSRERKRLDGGYTLEAGARLLELLSAHQARATIFIVGEIADWYPQLVSQVESSGHEIALHSHTHRLIDSKEVLEQELSLSREFIRRFRVQGFRAPRGHLQVQWIPLLTDADLVYDSSAYGPGPATETTEGIIELPITARPYGAAGCDRLCFGPLGFRTMFTMFPLGAPYVLGLLGLPAVRLIARWNHHRPMILCIHLWQVIMPAPRVAFALKMLLQSPMALPYCLDRRRLFSRLLERFRFTTLRDLSKDLHQYTA